MHSKWSLPTNVESVMASKSTSSNSVPRQPDPPVPVKVNHHSIELSWANQTPPVSGPNRPCYTVEMEDCSKSTKGDFVTVYR